MKYAFFVITACLAITVANAQTQFDVRDSLEAIVHKSTDDAQTRYRNAYNFLTAAGVSAEETEMFGVGVLCPFIMEAWGGR